MATGLEGFSDASADDGEEHKKKWEVDDSDLESDADNESENESKPERPKSIFERFKESNEDKEGEEKKPKSFMEWFGEKDEVEETETSEPVEAKPNPLAGADYLNPASAEAEEADPSIESVENEEFDSAVEQRIEQVDEEAASSDPKKLSEIIADADMLDGVRTKLHEGETPHDAIENAREEVLENPLPDANPEEIEIELDASGDIEGGELDVNDIQSDEEQLPPPPIPPSPSPPPIPPQPPQPPNYGNNPNFNPNNPNVPPTGPEDNDAETDTNQSRIGPKIAAAGAVGYMLGRRGGRKRTEARLQPQIDSQNRQINKQESDLSQLSKELDVAEAEVRAAASRAASEHREAAAAEAPKIDAEEAAAEAKAHAETMRAERDEFAKHEVDFEKVIDNTGVDEIVRTDSKIESPTPGMFGGNIGIGSEADEPESSKNKSPEKKPPMVKTIDAKTVPQPQLLELASAVPMENRIGLRQLYEARRIDISDMRRVVDAYLRGENYERILQDALEKGSYKDERKHEIKDSSGQQISTATGGSAGSSPSAVNEDSGYGPLGTKSGDNNSSGSPLSQISDGTDKLDNLFADKPMLSPAVAAGLGVITGLIFIAFLALFTDLI